MTMEIPPYGYLSQLNKYIQATVPCTLSSCECGTCESDHPCDDCGSEYYQCACEEV